MQKQQKMSMEDWKKQLNPSQLLAVETISGPVLVIAGAGSGKTRVIEYRVLQLVKEGVDPRSILLLTFTRRAARQMLSRASQHDPRCARVSGGTFHSFAYQMLRRYAPILGLSKNFTVLDEADAEEAIYRCAAELGIYEKEKRAPKKSTLKNIISMAINKNLSVSAVVNRNYPQFVSFALDIEKLRERYVRYKVEKSYLDYDDLLVYFKLLLENEAVRAKINAQYRYIMVDEYQDTNRLQGDITRLLGAHGNVMVVGDDAQSIYGFRGAHHGNIMDFPKSFPACRVIKLEDNYRSVQPILDVANAVMANMRSRFDKALRAVRGERSIKPQLQYFLDAYAEAEWIAESVKNARDAGIDLDKQAALFRSSYVSIPLQAELTKRNIPFQVYGGLKFYETAHVKDALAHLKVTANFRDELAWQRLLMLLPGVGIRTAADLAGGLSSLASLEESADYLRQFGETRGRLSGGLRDLSRLVGQLAVPAAGIDEKFAAVLRYYRPIFRNKYDDWRDRENDLEALLQIAGRYKKMEELLSDLALDPPEQGVAEVLPEQRDEPPMTLSTIHSAKGLEWHTVYLLGMADGILPSSMSLDREDDLEEERRLFYVALTRAKDQLCLSLHHESLRGGMSRFNKVSRFLDDPGIRAHLDVPAGLASGEEEIIELDEFGERKPDAGRKSLLDRLMEMYDKK